MSAHAGDVSPENTDGDARTFHDGAGAVGFAQRHAVVFMFMMGIMSVPIDRASSFRQCVRARTSLHTGLKRPLRVASILIN
jgi:hypothetical protein